jgi:RNA polymerase sigma-70 factor (ECF subfamily)
MNNKTPKYLDDDSACVLRAQKGEADAFRVLYQRYRHRILAFVRFRVKNHEIAVEITNQTFTKAFDKITQLKEPKVFCQWLFSIARNEIKMYFRDKKTDLADTSSIEDLIEHPLTAGSENNPLARSVRLIMKHLVTEGNVAIS